MKRVFCTLLALLTLCLAAFHIAPVSHAEEGGPLVITKSPGGEEINEGEDASFVSRARNYIGLVWLIISPDGSTIYENTEAEEAYPGLEMAGLDTEELELRSIPFTMNGCSVQTRFIDADGNAYLTERALIIVKQGIVPAPHGVKIVSGGARLSLGESKTLAVEAVSPSQDPIKYQWYRSYSAARNSGEPILGATESEYTPPEELGQVFYYVGVWCVRGRDLSAPIYTAPVAIVYSAPESAPTPEPSSAPSPVPTPSPDRGGIKVLLVGGNAMLTAIIALMTITVLAVITTALILHAVAKKQEEREDDPAGSEHRKR